MLSLWYFLKNFLDFYLELRYLFFLLPACNEKLISTPKSTAFLTNSVPENDKVARASNPKS